MARHCDIRVVISVVNYARPPLFGRFRSNRPPHYATDSSILLGDMQRIQNQRIQQTHLSAPPKSSDSALQHPLTRPLLPSLPFYSSD
jgi:hypothetical protein